MELKPLLRRIGTIVRQILTYLFALSILGVMIWTYASGYTIANFGVMSFSYYGLFLCIHMLIQCFFALAEHRRIAARQLPCSYTKSVGFTISAYQEDPGYLRECLNSVRVLQYPAHLLRIILVVDGNSEDDLYMMEIFKEIFADQDPGCYVWQNNYHTWKPTKGAGAQENSSLDMDDGLEEEEDPQRREVEELIKTKRCVCIMQKWGGKREVMYTAFKALGSTVDYIQVCDSDTKLDPLATCELVKVLESNEKYGAVGGDVMIFNERDSFVSFMSSLRYWMAFNIERCCQSFFDCVSCISGPLGLYQNNLLQQFLDSWYNQKFLGSNCTCGDDRHLTNRVLSMGYATKYTTRSKSYTETPSQFLRWLNQQTRWSKSYFREWLFNAKYWHKHHIWMTYESIVTGIFPFFVTATILMLFWRGTLWDIIWVLCCIQLIGLVKSAFACLLRRNLVMIFMSMFSALYMTSLLPAKFFAILTINKSTWGTSGRRKIVSNYIPLLPLSVWLVILSGALGYTIYTDTKTGWSSEVKQEELKYLIFGLIAYICYWSLMVFLFLIVFFKVCQKRSKTDLLDA